LNRGNTSLSQKNLFVKLSHRQVKGFGSVHDVEQSSDVARFVTRSTGVIRVFSGGVEVVGGVAVAKIGSLWCVE